MPAVKGTALLRLCCGYGWSSACCFHSKLLLLWRRRHLLLLLLLLSSLLLLLPLLLLPLYIVIRQPALGAGACRGACARCPCGSPCACCRLPCLKHTHGGNRE